MDRRNHVIEVLTVFDPGWLYLIAGLALVGATVIISAQDDVRQARHLRDVALDSEAQHLDRVERYADFLESLDAGDEATLRSVAATQLNLTTKGRISFGRDEVIDSSLFVLLEPDPIPLRPRVRQVSFLGRQATDDGARLWLLAAGCLSALYGLLPMRRR